MITGAMLRMLVATLALASVATDAKPVVRPEVLKVEPPNWWPGHSLKTVRLLVRGRHLEGASVGAADGLSTGLVRVNAAGSYLFVDVHIDPAARPGPRRLRLATAAGATHIPFELTAPLPPDGRFQDLSADDVLYLIMPDRFANGDPTNDEPAPSPGLLDRKQARSYHGGDFKGIIDRLPYLKDLGVTALWLTPWYDNANQRSERGSREDGPNTDYHGYGAVDFYAVEEHFGSLGTLRELVDAAHRHGIKLIQDQVANHTGPDHPWVQDPPTPTWYNGSAGSHLRNKWQSWTLRDPYATPQTQQETLRGWFLDVLPDLNQDDEECARYIIQNTLWWIGMSGLDGIRQDTLPYVHRRFWRDWMAAIKREYPRLTVVGELFEGDPTLLSFYQGGATRFDGIDSGIDALFDFPLYYAIRRAFAEGKPVREVAQALARDHLYLRPESLVTFLGLHDVPRFMNEPGARIQGLKLAFTFLMTARGVPLVYYGDEIAMPGGNDPDNRRDFPGGFPGDERSAFEASGRSADEQAVFEHLRSLLRLRREHAALRRGRAAHLVTEEQQYVYARSAEGTSVIVALNNDTQPAALDFDVATLGLAEATVLKDRLGVTGAARVESGRVRLHLPPRSAAVLAP